MDIHIKTIDHKSQKYPTVGDYWEDEEGVLQIRVSELGNWKENFLVAIHEMIEFHLCKHKGITNETITNFDLYYEKRREQGLVTENSEPGFSQDAPYKNQHMISTGVELILAALLSVDWLSYDTKVNSL
jgi:hypothetical protein